MNEDVPVGELNTAITSHRVSAEILESVRQQERDPLLAAIDTIILHLAMRKGKIHPLPIGPLRVLRRQFNAVEIRLFSSYFRDIDEVPIKIEIRVRKASQMPADVVSKLPARKHDKILRLGNLTLKLQLEQGLTRDDALEQAAKSINHAYGLRTLQEDFRLFREYCLSEGYVVSDRDKGLPQFPLSALDGQTLRKL